MTLKVEVISKETIKPSSTTPHHLRTLKLSLIDQYAYPVHNPFLFFYSAAHDDGDSKVKNDTQLDCLKKSLSMILTHFYPLAGRIDGNDFINCNDEGITFFEARVNAPLNQVVCHPTPEELNQFLPEIDNFYCLGPKVLLSIQVNIFTCGGIGLGVCTSHKIFDASSIAFFLKNWSDLARGNNPVIPPKFDMTSFFPPKDKKLSTFTVGSPTERVVSKRFVFDAPSIAALKAKSSSKFYVEHPSRVEVVSALIWKCSMNVKRMRMKSIKSTSVATLVNIRRKMGPPLSANYIGNIILISTIATSTTEIPPELHYLVGQLREATRKVDTVYVRKLLEIDGELLKHLDVSNNLIELDAKGELDLYSFSSLCRFPFYEVDFGWGKPIWVNSTTFDKGITILADTNCGTGVEAWVTLGEEDMAKFEFEPEIIAFTSDQSRLQLISAI